MANFKRNEELIKSDTIYAGKITEQGFYVGKFTQAYVRKGANSESEAIHLEFVADSGHNGQIDIWHTNRVGAQLDSGVKKINDLLVLLNINELKEKKNDKIEVFDFVVRATVDKLVTSYPQLVGKPIGTVWKLVESVKQEKVGDSWINNNPPQIIQKAEHVMFCDAESRATAHEFSKAIAPVYVDKYLSTLGVKRVDAYVMAAKDAQVIAKADNKMGSAPVFNNDFDYSDDVPF